MSDVCVCGDGGADGDGGVKEVGEVGKGWEWRMEKRNDEDWGRRESFQKKGSYDGKTEYERRVDYYEKGSYGDLYERGGGKSKRY